MELGQPDRGEPRWLTAKRGDDAAPARVIVVGCGLIGSSIARAVRTRWPRIPCVGVDVPEVLHALLERDWITQAAAPDRWIGQLRPTPADIVVLAVPLQAMPSAIVVAGSLAKKSASPLWIDVSSVKQPIIDRADQAGLARFIGGHPMAGSALQGWAASSASLLRGRPFVLCSSSGSTRHDLESATMFVQSLGARPRWMSAAAHDRVVALCSHLPHLLAQALMAVADRSPLREDVLALAAGSWRDATRVAASDPSLWAEVFTHNRASIAEATDALLHLLGEARERLRDPSTAAAAVEDAEHLAELRRALGPRLPKAVLATEPGDSA